MKLRFCLRIQYSSDLDSPIQCLSTDNIKNREFSESKEHLIHSFPTTPIKVYFCTHFCLYLS